MRIPFLSKRWERAERRAQAAEQRLAEAQVDLDRARRIAAESREIRRTNGFTEAIRAAMGVRHP